jgi:hypothetical protein
MNSQSIFGLTKICPSLYWLHQLGFNYRFQKKGYFVDRPKNPVRIMVEYHVDDVIHQQNGTQCLNLEAEENPPALFENIQ